MPYIRFWNHSKQHSSKTVSEFDKGIKGFGTIRNNTALKQGKAPVDTGFRFGTIRNNTALKRCIVVSVESHGFGTIRNNTALKQAQLDLRSLISFGTIRNNTALKLLFVLS